MRRISESVAILAVVVVLFLGIQYTASIAPQRSTEMPMRAGIPDAPAYTPPGGDLLPPETTATLYGKAGLGGWDLTAVSVSLSATDNGSGVSETLYSFSQYTWIPYSGPLNISSEGSTILYYYSTDVDGNREQMKNATIRIDTIAPATTVSWAGGRGLEGWYVSDVTVSLFATDGTSGLAYTEYSFNGIDWIRYSEPLVVSEEGLHLLTFRSADIAGNIESIQSATIAIDRNAPTTVAELDGKAGLLGWYLSGVTLTLVPSDSASVVADTEYRIDQSSWSSYSGPIVFYGDGVYTVYFWSVDYAGNTEGIRYVTISIDTTAPDTTMELAGTAGLLNWYVSDVAVTLMPSDGGSGIASVWYSFDGSTWNPYTTMFMLTSEGSTRLYYFSVDMAGNAEQALMAEISIDITPPTTDLDTESYYSTGMIVLTASDAISGVAHTYYRIDGVNWVEYSAPFQFGAAGGRNAIEYYSVDNAGNKEQPRSTMLVVTEVEVRSYVSYYPYPSCRYAPMTSFDVYFIRHGHGSYVLMTDSWLLWYNIEVKNILAEAIPTLSITPRLPSDFAMRAFTVWLVLPSGEHVFMYAYLNRTCHRAEALCPGRFTGVTVSFDGHAIAVTNLPANAKVFVSLAMEYKLRGSVFKSPDDFQIDNYTFSTVVQASRVYDSSYRLPVVSHVVKHYPRCHDWNERWILQSWGEFGEHDDHRH